MLADKELDQTAAQLAGFRTATEQHHATLSEVLEKYTELMQDYKRLKSDYEEERDSRERYKQMAKGQERNPFVLVLIDGDGYIFDDDLVSRGAEGGQEAARILNDVVKSSLRSRGLDHCRIMVRVYANLAGLSKALSKVKLAGPEKRSLAPFTASFNRSNELFDFVDAGELKENADFKIRAMFRQFVENAQCRHIYFAACHDVGYLAELTPYSGNRDRITLVRTPAFHYEFSKLGMRVEDFPNIFRTMPLDGQPSTIKAIPTRMLEPPNASNVDGAQRICPFFQKGICKYGKACHNLHVKVNTNGNTSASPSTGSLSDIRAWRQTSSSDNVSMPFQMSNLANTYNDFMGGNNTTNDPVQLQIDFATLLPQDDSIQHNGIPVNKHQHRLDPYMPPPSLEDMGAFNARTGKQHLCNNYQIHNNCPRGDSCPYDHSAASPAIVNYLKQVVRNSPCPKRGACRSLNCVLGHICQKADCKWRGGRIYCRFSQQTHNVDMNVAEVVSGNVPKDVTSASDAAGSVSGQGSTPPTAEARSLAAESDGDGEETEGALLDLDSDYSVD